MAKSEFDLIAEYFDRPGLRAESGSGSVSLGIGDDCAVLSVPEGHELALSMDILVEGVHFPENAPAELLACRALRVNLSDLAAMGAQPVGFTLGLTLPQVDEDWIQLFSDGLAGDAKRFSCPLLGGDTSRGPLAISIQVHGLVPKGAALSRSGARPGDGVFVSGSLGGAAAALQDISRCGESVQLFYRPEPRLVLGQRLRNVATAMLDISDGLLADLGHIARMSSAGIRVDADRVPVNSYARQYNDEHQALRYALGGGDDYELAFTAPMQFADGLEDLSRELNLPISCIGEVMQDNSGLVACQDSHGQPVMLHKPGYQHF